MRFRFLGLVLMACVGPPAPDVEICRDVIARVCAPPMCTEAIDRLSLPDAGCQTTLEQRTGCRSESFAFTSPTREEVLSCRLPLVRESSMLGTKPDCLYVDESLRACPDLVRFLRGTP